MVLMDTHIWLWWLLGDGALSDTERKGIDDLASKKQLALSWVSVWETEMLERKGRISFTMPFDQWIKQATSPEILQLWPADTDVVLAQRRLPEGFHADPADRLITATAILADCALITHDGKIQASGAVDIWEC